MKQRVLVLVSQSETSVSDMAEYVTESTVTLLFKCHEQHVLAPIVGVERVVVEGVQEQAQGLTCEMLLRLLHHPDNGLIDDGIPPTQTLPARLMQEESAD